MNLEDAKRLGLDEGGRLQVEEVLGENDQWLEKHVARLYAEVIGDDKAGGDLSVESKWREIEDKTPREELMRVFQMLSAEKASASGLPGSAASGAAPVPSGELPSGSVAERLFRILLVNGDRVERQIGARIGDELARRYRDLHNGFSGRWTSTYGCPQGAAETGAAQ